MKKLVLLFIAAIILTSPVYGLEALSSGGFAMLIQEGTPKVRTGYYVGFGIPVVQKVESGVTLRNENTYFYSDFGKEEIQAIRILAIIEKNIVSKYEVILDSSGLVSQSLVFRLYAGIGSGTWNVMKTSSVNNPEGNDELSGAFNFRAGGTFRGISLTIGVDIVQFAGSDLYAPSAQMALDF